MVPLAEMTGRFSHNSLVTRLLVVSMKTGKAVSNGLLTSSTGLGALVPQSVPDTDVMPKIVSPRLLLGYRTWSKLLTL